MKPSELTDDVSLIGATRNGNSLPVYDDGYGKLFIHRDSMDICGIVRARTWEDAYEICEDEFFPEASDTVEELRKEYNFVRRHAKIVRGADGIEREAVYPDDYPDGRLSPSLECVRYDTLETPCEDENGWTENELFCEAYGFRPNGPNASDTLKHGIYAKDLNGDCLGELTDALASELGIELQGEPNE